MKKTIAFILATVLAFSTCFYTMPSASAEVSSGEITDTISWSYDSETKTLTISGTGEIPLTYLSDPGSDTGGTYTFPWWSEDIALSIETVVFCEGITNIPQKLFTSIVGLTSHENISEVFIPASVTEIGFCAFAAYYGYDQDTKGIKYVHIAPGSQLTTIEEYAFYTNTSLESIDLTMCTHLKTIGREAFMHSPLLENVYLPVTDAEGGLEIYDGAFSFTAVSELYLPETTSLFDVRIVYNSSNAQKITVNPDSPYYCDIDGVLYSKDKTNIVYFPEDRAETEYVVADSVTKISPSCFLNAQNLTAIYYSNTPEQYTYLPDFYDEYNTYLDCPATRYFLNGGMAVANEDGTYSVQKEGHTFAGWYTDSTLETPATIYGKGQSVDVVAAWTPIIYTLMVDPNGGTYNNTKEPTVQNVFQSCTYEIPDPTHDDYVFIGWTLTDGNGETSATMTRDEKNSLTKVTMGDTNATLTAKWAHKLSYYHVGADLDTLLQSDSYEKIDESEKLSSTPIRTDVPGKTEGGVPIREGYIFAGWYTTKQAALDLDNKYSFDKNTSLKAACESKDVNLYTGWVKVDELTQENDGKLYPATLKGFDLVGVQLREINTLDTNSGKWNKDYTAIRFITLYGNVMLSELEGLWDKSKDVGYGYIAIAGPKADTVSSLTHADPDAHEVVCTRGHSNIKKDHFEGEAYRISSMTIDYDGLDRTTPVAARAYVSYTDANGFERYSYNTYSGTAHLGGCKTSLDAASKLVPDVGISNK